MKHFSISAWLQAIIFSGFIGTCSAQVSIITQQSIGGSGTEGMLPGIIRLNDDRYLLAAQSNSPISGSKTSPLFGGNDGWAIRLSPYGNPLWQKTFGGSEQDFGGAVVELPDAFYFGFSSGSAPGGTKTQPAYGTGADRSDYWLIKTDRNGNILWQKVFGTEQPDILTSMAIAPGNVLILAGYSASDASLDKSENSQGGDDFWILAVDPSGNKLWDKTIGGFSRDRCLQVHVLSDGLLFIGNSSSPPSGHKQAPALGKTDVWIVKTDFNGDIIKDYSIGGSKDDYFYNADLLGGHIYITGSGFSPDLMNMNNTNQGEEDGWLAELDSLGLNMLRIKSFGSSATDRAASVLALPGGRFMLTLSSDGYTGDKNIPPVGMMDNWLLYLDQDWNIRGQQVIGGPLADNSLKSFSNSDGSVTMFSWSQSDFGGNKQVPQYGNGDIWMYRFRNLTGNEEESAGGQSLKLFPNPVTDICVLTLPESLAYEKLRVVNAAGQSVYETNLNPAEGSTYTLNTASWAPGAYFVDLQTKQGLSLRSTLLKK